MTDKIKGIEEDIAELKKLSLQAQRPNVQTILANHISELKTELELLNKITQSPKKVEPVQAPKITNKIYIPLTKYAWDQEGTKVKLFFTLQNVGNEVTADRTEFNFGNDSIQFKLHGYKGQNYIFAVKKLFGQIKPADCKYLIKTNTISITLIKKQNKSWSQINFKDEKFKAESEDKQSKEDPSAGIMNMMKKMYNQGDDTMKKTIAQAWTKAQDKKQKPHDFSDRFDWLKKD